MFQISPDFVYVKRWIVCLGHIVQIHDIFHSFISLDHKNENS